MVIYLWLGGGGGAEGTLERGMLFSEAKKVCLSLTPFFCIGAFKGVLCSLVMIILVIIFKNNWDLYFCHIMKVAGKRSTKMKHAA